MPLAPNLGRLAAIIPAVVQCFSPHAPGRLCNTLLKHGSAPTHFQGRIGVGATAHTFSLRLHTSTDTKPDRDDTNLFAHRAARRPARTPERAKRLTPIGVMFRGLFGCAVLRRCRSVCSSLRLLTPRSRVSIIWRIAQGLASWAQSYDHRALWPQ